MKVGQIIPREKIAGRTPILELLESDQAYPAGMWRWEVSSDVASLKRATAADWSASESWIQFDKDNAQIIVLKTILPAEDNVQNLGSALKSFANVHVQTIVYATTVSGSWSPDTDDTYYLGTDTEGWKGFRMPDTFICDESGYVRFRNNADDAFVGIRCGALEPSSLALGADGIDVNPGSDTDADLVTVGVNGTPIFSWDESEDEFTFNKGLQFTGNPVKIIAAGSYASMLTHQNSELITLAATDTTGWILGIGSYMRATGTDGKPFAGMFFVESTDTTGTDRMNAIQAMAFLGTVGGSEAAHLKTLGGDATAGMYAGWFKVGANVNCVCDAGSRVAPLWVDNQMSGAVSGEEYALFITCGGSKVDAVFGLETTSSGWTQLFYFDETSYDQDPVSGESLKVLINTSQRYIALSTESGKFTGTLGAVTMTGAITLGENGIQLDHSIGTDQNYSGITRVGTAGETVAVGEVIYLEDTDGEWHKAQANAAATARGFIGICVSGGDDGEEILVLLYGQYRDDDTFNFTSPGEPIYLFDDTAGDLVATAPSDSGDIVRVIAYQTEDADEIFVNPSGTWVEVA